MHARQVQRAQSILGNISPIKSMPTTPAAPRSSYKDAASTNVAITAPSGGRNTGLLGAMHKGGIVPKTGNYTLKKGETVTPAPEDQGSGRTSEYRKVYVARRQSRQGGGNTPAKGEKHDQKKATKGIKKE